MRLAVIIPAHNRRDLLLETLASVRAQTVSPWRVVIVDDGSTDGTADAAEAWLFRHPMECGVKVVRQANAGVSMARNRGAEEAGDADLLAFLDSDDLWSVDFVEQALRVFQENPAMVAATSDRMDVEYGRGWKSEVVHPWPVHGRGAMRFLRKGVIAYPCATVFCARAVHRAGGYRPGLNYGEDFILTLTVASFGPWGRIESLPAVRRQFRHGAARQVTHLSRTFDPDVLVRFAEELEKECRRHGFAKEVSKVMAHKWRRAGKALAEAGRMREAGRCYKRAIRCCPWDLKARWRLPLLTLGKAGKGCP